jgi:hypothetical protein
MVMLWGVPHQVMFYLGREVRGHLLIVLVGFIEE